MSFENGGDSLEAVSKGIRVLRGGCDMCHHQAGGAFVEDKFACADDGAEATKQALD